MKNRLRPLPAVLLVRGLGLLLAAAPPVEAQNPPAVMPVSAETYLQPPVLSQPRLSPDGSKVGIRLIQDGRQYVVAIGEPGTGAPTRYVSVPGISITDFWWKGNDLLLLRLSPIGPAGPVSPMPMGGFTPWQLFDLKANRLLPFPAGGRGGLPTPRWEMPDDPDAMLFTVSNTAAPLLVGGVRVTSQDLASFDLRTGQQKLLERDPGFTTDWMLDRQGTAVAAWGLDEKNWVLWWRERPGAKWKPIRQPLKDGPPKIQPLATAPDQRRLVAADYHRHPGGEFVIYDPATGAAEPISGAGVPGNNPEWERWGRRGEAGAVVGTGNGVRQPTFFDPQVAAIRRSLQDMLPETDIVLEDISADGSRFLVQVVSERTAGAYVLVDRNQGKLFMLGERFPGLGSAPLLRARVFGLRTAGGLELSGRILLPAGRERPPLIVVVRQGSPVSYEAVTAANEMQYFASRGYAVAELDSSASEVGQAPSPAQTLAGRRGDQRQELVEAVRWLAAQGLIDPRKVAVLGTFAGGGKALADFAPGGVVQALVNFGTPLRQPGAGPVVAASAAAAQAAMVAPVPKQLPGVPSFHYYTVGNQPARGGVAGGPGFSPEYESAKALVAALQKNKLVAELVTSAEIVRGLRATPEETALSPAVRGRRDELVIEFLKRQGIE